MTLDYKSSIFFGQPLIDAYLLQEELSLYCIVVASSAEQEFEKKGFIDKEKLILRNYQCNFKGGQSSHLTIPPLYAVGNIEKYKSNQTKLLNGIKKLGHRTSGYLRKYIDYTQLYINDSMTTDEIY